jgi:ribosomal protein S20
LIRFGKIHISPDKLHYKNILAVKNGLKRNYVGIPEKKVSDALASTIMKIVDGGSIKKSDLHVLSPNDKHIYDKLMMMSGLHKTHDNTFDESSKEMKARLRLIEGEISAGNDNIALLKEAHQLLHSMARSGIISNYSAGNHYKHLQSFF